MAKNVRSDKSNPNHELRRSFCLVCDGYRRCIIQGSFCESHGDEEFGWTEANWRILQCTKCDSVFMEVACVNFFESSNSIDFDGKEEITHPENLFYWPEPTRSLMSPWFRQHVMRQLKGTTGSRLPRALEELYISLGSELYLLSALGIQHCFDIASELLGLSTDFRFSEKLDALVVKGYLDPLDRRKLNVIVESTTPSANTGRQPTIREVRVSARILEDFIFDIFVRPRRDAKPLAPADIKKMRAPRRPSLKRTRNVRYRQP